MAAAETLRNHVRTSLARLVPDRPYARNIEKSVWEWAVAETKRHGEPHAFENRIFRSRYKHKALTLLKELTRGEWITCSLAPDASGHVRVALGTQPQLIHRILSKEIKSTDLVHMSPQALWPEGPTAAAVLRAKERDLQKERAKASEENYTGLFKCGKCKSVKTTYYQLQTRSADEPMVRFCVFLYDLFSTTNSSFRQPTSRARIVGAGGSARRKDVGPRDFFLV
jgi:DNA-directed RNA polymerase subunit M/transcription elongation factor TFIIS